MPDLAPLSPQWWLEQLFDRLMERRDEIEFFDAYYRGDHPLPWLAPQAREEFRRILRMTRSNYMGLVVDAQVERVNIEGFRFGDDGVADADTWRIFQANNLDSDSDQAILEASICGRSYLQVAPNPDDAKTPLITVEHASQAILAYEPGSNRRKRAAGLKVWDDEWTQALMATLQLADGTMWKFQAKRPEAGGKPQWVERIVPGEAANGLRRNPLKVVSLVEVANNPRLLHGGISELSDVTDIQDRVNKTMADRLITQDYGAFPQRWISAWPEEDAQGNPNPQIDIGRNRVITTEVAETKFGQWDAAPMDPYSNAKREDVKDIASRTRTPSQYLLGEMSNVNGEALALDTPVVTPRGLVPIGDIRDGDEVYDERGEVRIVEHAHPVLLDRPCNRITFDDGSSFVADDNHRWAVVSIPEARRKHKGINQRTERSVLTTREIRESLLAANGQKVHAIDLASAPDGPEVDLPVDPYVLGAYLGDGNKHAGSICTGDDDLSAMVDLLTMAGESVTVRAIRTVNLLTCGRNDNRGALRGRLDAIGVLFDKHIPEAYFAASAKQRLALLQGLMDTDGTTSSRHVGTVALDLHNERLARDAYRLICSLGHKVSLRTNAFTKGSVTGNRYRMRWCPPETVFRLPRKVETQERRYVTGGGVGSARPKTLRRTVVSVEQVESVPVRCLTVSGPNHLFLVGEAHVPTHNTLKASESGLVSKVRQRSRGYAEGFEEAMRLARTAAGLSTPKDAAMETIFTDPQYRTAGEMADATVKLFQAGIVSLRQAREDLGYSVAQIERMETDDAAAKADPTMERLMRELTSAPSAPSGDGGLLPQPAVADGPSAAGSSGAVGTDGARL